MSADGLERDETRSRRPTASAPISLVPCGPPALGTEVAIVDPASCDPGGRRADRRDLGARHERRPGLLGPPGRDPRRVRRDDRGRIRRAVPAHRRPRGARRRRSSSSPAASRTSSSSAAATSTRRTSSWRHPAFSHPAASARRSSCPDRPRSGWSPKSSRPCAPRRTSVRARRAAETPGLAGVHPAEPRRRPDPQGHAAPHHERQGAARAHPAPARRAAPAGAARRRVRGGQVVTADALRHDDGSRR